MENKYGSTHLSPFIFLIGHLINDKAYTHIHIHAHKHTTLASNRIFNGIYIVRGGFFKQIHMNGWVSKATQTRSYKQKQQPKYSSKRTALFITMAISKV